MSENGTNGTAPSPSPRYARFTCECGREVQGLGPLNRHKQFCTGAKKEPVRSAGKRHEHPPIVPKDTRPPLDDERPAEPSPILESDASAGDEVTPPPSPIAVASGEDPELDALVVCYRTLARLEPAARDRAFAYLSSRLGSGA